MAPRLILYSRTQQPWQGVDRMESSRWVYPGLPRRTSNTILGILNDRTSTNHVWVEPQKRVFLLFYSAFGKGTLAHTFDAQYSSVRKAVVFQRIKMILLITKLMSPKDSDSLSGARFTQAGVRRALKRKILFMCCVKNPQIEFRWAANLRPHLTSSDLTWPGRFTAILRSYQKFLGSSPYFSVHLRSHSHWAGTMKWEDLTVSFFTGE